MEAKTLGLLAVAIGVGVLTSAQILIKLRLTAHGPIPVNLRDGVGYAIGLAGDWQIWVGFIGLVIASLLWYWAVSRIPLSLAYPVSALAYPIIFVGSIIFIREPPSWQVLVGNLLILCGVVLAVRGTG